MTKPLPTCREGLLQGESENGSCLKEETATRPDEMVLDGKNVSDKKSTNGRTGSRGSDVLVDLDATEVELNPPPEPVW